MTPGISFSTDLSVLFFVNSVGTKTDISLLNGKAAKVTVSNGSVEAAEVNSVPAGASFRVPLTGTFLQIGYRPAENQCCLIGEVIVELGITIRRHAIDMSNGAELYLSINSSNELVVTLVK